VISKALAIALTVSVGPAIREVPESTIPYFKPEKSYPAVLILDKVTGQYVSLKRS
jgi:hypothetical protein